MAFDLGDHDNKEDILKAVDDISYSGGGMLTLCFVVSKVDLR